jgi:hypothetical protein
MNQERKNKIAPQVKKILAKYHVKGSLSVDRHTGLTLTIRSGKIDFCQNWHENRNAVYARDGFSADKLAAPTYVDVNVYHIDSHFSGKASECLEELLAAMNQGNWDRSDIQSDYWDRGWYCNINVGRWNNAYIYQNASAA